MNLKAELLILGKIERAKGGSLFFTDNFLRFCNFSEDIDLAIDRIYLGFDGELSKNQRTNFRKKTSSYTTLASSFPVFRSNFGTTSE